MKKENQQVVQIVEKYFTISGEAPNIGEPIYLIRFSNCNINCLYCDTKYKNEVNYEFSENQLIDDIKNAINQYPSISILFTGGEPLLNDKQKIFYRIAKKFPKTQFYIETNGTIRINRKIKKNMHFVVDWKTRSSGYGNSFILNNLSVLREKYDCIKIVVSQQDLDDINDIIKVIRFHNKKIKIFISPQSGILPLNVLADYIINNKLDITLSVQLHKIIWGDIRGR